MGAGPILRGASGQDDLSRLPTARALPGKNKLNQRAILRPCTAAKIHRPQLQGRLASQLTHRIFGIHRVAGWSEQCGQGSGCRGIHNLRAERSDHGIHLPAEHRAGDGFHHLGRVGGMRKGRAHQWPGYQWSWHRVCRFACIRNFIRIRIRLCFFRQFRFQLGRGAIRCGWRGERWHLRWWFRPGCSHHVGRE